MVETYAAVRPLAAVKEAVGCCARADNGHAECVVLIRVGHGASAVRQESNIPVPIIPVEAGRSRTADELIFADAL